MGVVMAYGNRYRKNSKSAKSGKYGGKAGHVQKIGQELKDWENYKAELKKSRAVHGNLQELYEEGAFNTIITEYLEGQ